MKAKASSKASKQQKAETFFTELTELDKDDQDEIAGLIRALADRQAGKLYKQSAAELKAITQATDIDRLRPWLVKHCYLAGAQ